MLKGSGAKRSATYGINDSIGIQSSDDQHNELLLDKGEDDGYKRIKTASIKSNKLKVAAKTSIASTRIFNPVKEVESEQLISKIRWLRD